MINYSILAVIGQAKISPKRATAVQLGIELDTTELETREGLPKYQNRARNYHVGSL